MDIASVVRDIIVGFPQSQERVERQPLFLLLHNGPHNYFQNAQGQVEFGEPLEQAALREGREETGLYTCSHGIFDQLDYDAPRNGELRHVELNAFLLEADSTAPLMIGRSNDAHDAAAWLPYEAARRELARFPEQRAVFDHVVYRAGLMPNETSYCFMNGFYKPTSVSIPARP